MVIDPVVIKGRSHFVAPRAHSGEFVQIGEPGNEQGPVLSPGKPQVMSPWTAHRYEEMYGFSFGQYHEDPRENGPTFIAMNGEGYVYNPKTDDFQLELDIECLFTTKEAGQAAIAKADNIFEGALENHEDDPCAVEVLEFSKLSYAYTFFWVDDNDLGHPCEREDATVFGADLYIEYPGWDTDTQLLLSRGNCPISKFDGIMETWQETYPAAKRSEEDDLELEPAPGP